MNRIPLQLADDIREVRASGLTKFAEDALEKDFHISAVLNLVAQLNQENFLLVFCGGTSLVKAHHIIQRMSEDVDFKIILDQKLSTSAQRKVLSRIKREFLELLSSTNYSHTGFQAKNNNSYFEIGIMYDNAFLPSTSLRPHIKVEFTNSVLALPTQTLTATTLIGNVVPEYLNPVVLECQGLEETTGEKVVSFLRRSLPYFRESNAQYEGQLVRHIYDVHMLTLASVDLKLAREAATSAYINDALRYANTNSAFAVQPREELLAALTSLDQEEISRNYELFVKDLLSDEGPPLDVALETFTSVAHALLD